MNKLTLTCLAFFLAVVFPQSVGSQTAATSPAAKSDYPQESYIIERLSQKVEFQNDGTSTSETTLRAKVQSDAGVKQLGLLVFQYTQANDSLEIPYVRVLKPDGSTVVTPAGNIQDLPADVTREAPFYSDLRQKHVAVRGLSAGDTLEYQVRTRTHAPQVPGQFWLVDDFTRNAIVLEETLEVSVPGDRAVKTKFGELKPTVTEEGGRRICRWKTSNLKRKTEDELKADSAEPPAPAVQFTTFQSFEEVGQWYDRLQRERVEPMPEIRAKAAELTKGAKTDGEKLKAIYDYVSLNFRYIGIAFGIGRYQPNAAADVLANQYGDCKDKHTLLASLLKAAGLAGYPALINSSRKTDGADTLRLEVYGIADISAVLQARAQTRCVRNKPKGTLSFEGGKLRFEEARKEVFAVATTDVKEAEVNFRFGVNTGTFRVILSSGQTYNFVATSLRPADTQAIVDTLKRALK